MFMPIGLVLFKEKAISFPNRPNSLAVAGTINQYSFICWHDIITDTNAIAIYIAGLEYKMAKYPECPADNDIYRA